MTDKQSMMLLFADLTAMTTLALAIGNRDDASMILDTIFRNWREIFESRLERDIREANDAISSVNWADALQEENALRQSLQTALDETETMLRGMMGFLTGGIGGLNS